MKKYYPLKRNTKMVVDGLKQAFALFKIDSDNPSVIITVNYNELESYDIYRQSVDYNNLLDYSKSSRQIFILI